MKEKRQYILVIMIILTILIIDQVIKIVIMSQNEPVEIGNDIIKINYIKDENEIQIKQVLTSIFADLLVILILSKFLVMQIKNMNIATKVAISFVLAGAISNVIDRIIRGKLINYIDISNLINKFPIFNLAHIFIVLGFIIFVIMVGVDLIKMRQKEEKTNFDKENTSKID